MPNWCHNRVSFYSDNEQDIKEIYEFFTGDEPFNTILPSPDWKTTPNDKGELPIKREMKSPKTGEVFHTTYDFPDGTNDDRWYAWNSNNWGCKWDIHDVDCDELDDCVCFECSFETPWSPPEGIYQTLRDRYPDVSISWFWDEPGMQAAGYLNN